VRADPVGRAPRVGSGRAPSGPARGSRVEAASKAASGGILGNKRSRSKGPSIIPAQFPTIGISTGDEIVLLRAADCASCSVAASSTNSSVADWSAEAARLFNQKIISNLHRVQLQRARPGFGAPVSTFVGYLQQIR